MLRRLETPSLRELRTLLRAYCEKHRVRRLEVFGSAANNQAGHGSDVDLLVTLDDSKPISTAALLEMAGEVEESIGTPVDFALRPSLEESANPFARDHILASAVCIYGVSPAWSKLTGLHPLDAWLLRWPRD